MKDNFIFQGKNYISVKRASEISDYTSDYIGQLCRSGKLDCQRVGRGWFITEDSLMNHRRLMLQDNANRNRIENIRGRNRPSLEEPVKVSKNISKSVVSLTRPLKTVTSPNSVSNRNSSVEGASVAADALVERVQTRTENAAPVAGVAQGPSLESSSISNSCSTSTKGFCTIDDKAKTGDAPAFLWSSKVYVPHGEPANLIEKISLGENLNEGDILRLKAFAVQTSVAKVSEENDIAKNETVTAGSTGLVATQSGTIYLSDNRPLLPVLNKDRIGRRLPEIRTSGAVRPALGNIDARKTAMVSVAQLKTSAPVPTLRMSESKPVSRPVEKVSAPPLTENKSVLRQGSVKVASSKTSPLSKPAKRVPTYPVLARSIILRRALIGTLSLVVLAGFIGVTGLVIDSGALKNAGRVNLAVNLETLPKAAAANLHDALVSFNDFIDARLGNMVAWFNRPVVLTVNNVTSGDTAPAGKTDESGSMAVFPSSGSGADDAVMKDKIRNSFSDEVNIYPDQSGTTGVIKPVFKETDGKDFIYVMVPLRDSQGRTVETTLKN